MSLLHGTIIIDDIDTAQYHLRTKSFTYYHWSILSCEYTLTECFIEKYIDKLNWYRIQIYQTLSESFINKYADKLDWNLLSQYQLLSQEMIYKYKNKINWSLCFRYQTIQSGVSGIGKV